MKNAGLEGWWDEWRWRQKGAEGEDDIGIGGGRWKVVDGIEKGGCVRGCWGEAGKGREGKEREGKEKEGKEGESGWDGWLSRKLWDGRDRVGKRRYKCQSQI